MKHMIRFIILLFSLVMMGISDVWAISESDIIINVLPNSTAGTVSVTNISDMTVTITATPATGYTIDAAHVLVEKMVDPMAASRRAPGISSSLPVSGNNPFTFTIPDGYTGAYVTVTFFKVIDSFIAITSLSQISDLTKNYQITADIDGSSLSTSLGNFTGTLDGGFHKIYNLSKPLFSSTSGSAVIRNITFEAVGIDIDGNAGAVTASAAGSTRIYNCGILPISVDRDANGNITGFSGSSVKGTGDVGGLVGTLSGNARVINCYSYANITGGSNVAGIVGQNTTTAITQDNVSTVGMVVNCMFYGEITGGTIIRPVYGGNMIKTDDAKGVNPYCYFRAKAGFNNDTNFDKVDNYNRSWPADDEYLTRFEYYRSILNSNRQLCTYWVTDKTGTNQTTADTALIAKWVLDPSVAPFPILKKWGKYPSVINSDRDKTWNTKTKSWVSRSTANAYEGKNLGTLKVTVQAGSIHHKGKKPSIVTLRLPITDMDTLNCDYGYAKIQLPYYNEQFGDPTVPDVVNPTDADPETNHKNRYGGNYTDYVVTGWEITSVTDSRKDNNGNYIEGAKERNSFVSDWESGYNFADRNCIDKDLYETSGRVFAQGGYYYVPEDVTEITITAHWGKAFYLHNAGHNIDRVNVTSGSTSNTSFDASKGVGNAFAPAGTLPTDYHGYTVYTSWQEAIKALGAEDVAPTVFDQAIVLVGNLQLQNRSMQVGTDLTSDVYKPFTMMSADLDLDNEPDYCFQLQFRYQYQRRGIQPIRFDFLTIPELGLAVRHNTQAYAIGIFVPQGHFEITETACMHTTQFEYDAGSGKTDNNNCGPKKPAPIILNGGHFEQIVARYSPQNTTTYFLMGGHFRMKRFTPGAHANKADKPQIRLCAVNCIGGEFPEFYLSGYYHPDIVPTSVEKQGNPHCYTNGGKFGTMAGAGYDKILGSVFWEIDHSVIREFYGGGINAARPIGGSIDVTINNSLVTDIYCGGPKVGPMTTGTTVKTSATNTIFNRFFGGGNGGNSYYRKNHTDGDLNWPSENADGWNQYGYSAFNPLKRYVTDTTEGDLGIDALFEFEVFNSSNGLDAKAVLRTYYNYIEFGTTTTGDVTNTLTGCTVKENFFGGGNLGNVVGSVTSTLTNTHVMKSVFAGGFSAAIPTFRVHDKSKTHFPHRDKSGTIIDGGSLEYKDIYYEWTNEQPSGVTKSNPAFWDSTEQKWKCYTEKSLEGLGEVSQDATITINGTTHIDGNVYGGGDQSAVRGATNVLIAESATIGGVIANSGDVYGGGNVANVGGNTKVFLLGGTVNGDVYGGGKGRLEAGTSGEDGYVSPIAATVGSTKVNLNGLETGDYVAADHSALVEVYPEEATGEDIQYYTLKSGKTGCVVKGNIFGCNNLNGTPKGSVTVNVYKTEGYDGHQRTGYNAETATAREAALDDIDDTHHSYEVKAVYGGGNLAAYEPDDANNKQTEVNIYGCGDTSIQQVYGGGNAASTPATQVHVYGTYEIEEVFGGGNGKDDISRDGGTTYIKNPGANVGFKDYWDYENEKDKEEYDTKEKRAAATAIIYGTGAANVNIHGGRIHRVYGGSNTKGNVKTVAVTMLEDQEVCDFKVDEAYGGGKSAEMDGASRLEMACIPGLKNAYGGAEAADIASDVTLNITNGNFNRVFGGNNVSGTIHGRITVNIEETGCHLITIGQLYGGGNQAAYTGPEILDDEDKGTGVFQGPTVNVKSFTSIGEVYGGGYGKTAIVKGDTYVNINVCDGKTFDTPAKQTAEITSANTHTGDQLISFSEFKRTDDGGFVTDDDGNRIVEEKNIHVYLPPYEAGIGNIGNVYGGGNAAKVDGSTHVNIGTVDGDITFETPTADAEEDRKHTVKGANIVGNVYGGGNAAEVTGNTNVTIGKGM